MGGFSHPFLLVNFVKHDQNKIPTMNKSTFFTGQPIFHQLIQLIPRSEILKICSQNKSDHYCKKFDTWHHLITMLYSIYQQCTSLREVVTGMRACEGKLHTLGIKYFPARSTLSDANYKRSHVVFEQIYYRLYQHWRHVLPDSLRREKHASNLILVDSTTISLFQEILRNAGKSPANGKRKGGIKVHMSVYAAEQVPYLVKMTPAITHDSNFMYDLHFPKGSVVVFDRAYHNISILKQWTDNGITWVTRRRAESVIIEEGKQKITSEEKDKGIRKDTFIQLGSKQKTQARIVRYFDADTKRTFEFVTNNRKLSALTIASLYKKRWQIELIFKRLKQNMPLKYFLGDNENAIRIQIWCALIADLLLKIVTIGLKRKWAFSNLAALVRLHLMNYTELRKFLENPEKTKITIENKLTTQLKISFLTG